MSDHKRLFMLVLLPAVIILLAVIITVQLGCDVPPQTDTPQTTPKAGAVFEALWQLQDTTRLHNPLPGDYHYFSEGEVVTVHTDIDYGDVDVSNV